MKNYFPISQRYSENKGDNSFSNFQSKNLEKYMKFVSKIQNNSNKQTENEKIAKVKKTQQIGITMC